MAEEKQWPLFDQIRGAYVLTGLTVVLTDLLVEMLSIFRDWSWVKAPAGTIVALMIAIGAPTLCLLLVAHHMHKKIFWLWTALAGVLIAYRLTNHV